MAKRFVLVRITDMRGVDLNVFTFDYDLAWAGLFLDADQHVLGRFGGRVPESAERYHSLAGLRYAMQQTLIEYKHRPNVTLRTVSEFGRIRPTAKPNSGEFSYRDLGPNPGKRTVEQYPAIKRFRTAACIHCHQAYDFAREAEVAAGTWDPESLWVYPSPENLGVRLAMDQQNIIEFVSPASPAALLGLKRGDMIQTLNGVRVASFADAQYALHQVVNQKSIPIIWSSGGHSHEGKLSLPEGWRRTDLSWRASARSIGADPSIQGWDLSTEEKQTLGLGPRQLAFRQGSYPVPVVRQAGIKPNDVIVGVDGKRLELNVRQFLAYIRLSYHAGDRITFNILRNGQRIEASLILPASLNY